MKGSRLGARPPPTRARVGSTRITEKPYRSRRIGSQPGAGILAILTGSSDCDGAAWASCHLPFARVTRRSSALQHRGTCQIRRQLLRYARSTPSAPDRKQHLPVAVSLLISVELTGFADRIKPEPIFQDPREFVGPRSRRVRGPSASLECCSCAFHPLFKSELY